MTNTWKVSTGTMVRVCVTALTLVMTAAGAAVAQTGSAIAGVVTDAQGLRMPGVTVEASSPALIEKVRVVTTDEQGAYKITDLRAGIYTVTFSLPGFATLRREGLELTAAFTATVNGELALGALGEEVRVVAGAPLLDVENVVQRRVVTRDVIDAVPTGNKSWAALAMLVPGAKVSGGAAAVIFDRDLDPVLPPAIGGPRMRFDAAAGTLDRIQRIAQ